MKQHTLGWSALLRLLPLIATSILALICGSISFQVAAKELNTTANIPAEFPVKRPTIALVLAGGGAKGAAHVGVLQALEEMHVPLDIITGTSMGAYIGGLYSSGQNAQQIEQTISRVDWNSGYRDKVSRAQLHIREKEFDDRYRLDTDLGFRFDTLDIRAPKGVIQGQNMLRIIRETSADTRYLDSFDQLPIRYRAVATDIVKLEPVVLNHGYLADAFMASMSVPGVLPPYEVDGQLLVDGGVTNNMPVDVARALGADIVIAVDISTDYKSEEQFTTFLTVADQLTNYLVRQSSQKQAQKLRRDDIYIKPAVGDMETVEFDRINEAYQKGYAAVQLVAHQLKALSLSAKEYQDYRQKIQLGVSPLGVSEALQFSQIQLENNTHYSDTVLLEMLGIRLDKPVSQQQIERHIKQLYALDRFELINYQIKSDQNEQILVVQVREKSWGPNYMTFRLALEDDFDNQSRYSVGISNNFTGLDAIGSELRLDMEMGTDRRIALEYFRPLSQDQTIFSSASLIYQKEERQFSELSMEDVGLGITDNYYAASYIELVGELALGYQYNPWDEIKLGLLASDGEASLSTLPSWGDMQYQRKGLFARYRLDTLDNYSFPSHGWYLDLDYMLSNDRADIIKDGVSSNISDWVYEYSATVLAAKSRQRHTLVGRAEYGGVDTDKFTYPIHPLSLGGFLNLSGIPNNTLNGQNKAYTSLTYRYRWFDNDFGLFTSPVYLGAAYEYGGIWSDPDIQVDHAPLYQAAALFAGIDSPIGPIMFGYGRTENNYDSIYLVVGTGFK